MAYLYKDKPNRFMAMEDNHPLIVVLVISLNRTPFGLSSVMDIVVLLVTIGDLTPYMIYRRRVSSLSMNLLFLASVINYPSKI